MVNSIKSVLMDRDDMPEDEADDLIEEALDDLRLQLDDGASISALDDFCEQWFGLEPDYMEELLNRIN